MSPENTLRVTIRTRYIPFESCAEEDHYVFGYVITIENQGDVAYTLMSRYWKITDANGGVKEIEGRGVVGQTPLITPGNSFTYDSHAVLPTEAGSMEGHYKLQDEQGHFLIVPIPPFLLANPECVH